MANINNISCATLHKLTWREISELGLLNDGVWTLKGNLKARKAGYKTVKVNSYVTSFESAEGYIEFTELANEEGDENKNYAVRVYGSQECGYVRVHSPLFALDFFK